MILLAGVGGNRTHHGFLSPPPDLKSGALTRQTSTPTEYYARNSPENQGIKLARAQRPKSSYFLLFSLMEMFMSNSPIFVFSGKTRALSVAMDSDLFCPTITWGGTMSQV